MAGPRKETRSLNEITSTQAKDPKLVESKSELILECPPELGPLARQEWDRLLRELTASDLLKNVDRGPLALYCAAYALWAEATDALQKYSAMMKSPSGYPIQSPYVSIANRQAEIMMRIASEFGFTPASRSRIAMPSAAEPSL